MGRVLRSSASLVLAFLLFTLAGCGGGGGGGSDTPAATIPPATTPVTKVAVTGSLSAAAAKPSLGKSAQLYAVSSWAGATLQVIDSTGAVVGTGTVNADGTYSVSVPKGSNYFIRVQIGNLVLKAFVPSVTADATVPVNTTTTAEVLVLASVLGVANAGEPSVSTATAIATVNVTTVITQIEANTSLSTLAASLATEIAGSYDSTATTPAIGSASVTVTGTVSTISGTVGGSVVPAAPSAPAGVGITGGNGQATISWTAVTGAASYNVYYRASTAGVTKLNGTKKTGATSGGAVTGLTNGTAYYFVVTAVNAGGESAVSSEVGATPQIPVTGAPAGVGVTGGNAQATVSWTAVTGATSYNVYRGTSAGVTKSNGTKTTGATSGGAITGLTKGTAYYFVVTAVNAGGESAVSSEVSATPLIAAPTGVTATTTAGIGKVTLSWTAPAGTVASYNVYRGTSAGVTKLNGTKTTGATPGGAITGLANNTKYYFVVTALNAGGESAASGEVSVTTLKVPRFAYVANGTSNTVSIYTVDGTTGALRHNGYVAATIPISVTVDPSGKFAYVANYTASGTVSAYAINQTTGALAAVAGAGNGTTGTNASGVIAAGTDPCSVTVDPSGKFAYVANIGSDNVSVYTINQTTGALTAGTAVAAGTLPTGVTVDPSSKFAYVSNRASGNVSVYTINQSTGALAAVVGTGNGTTGTNASGVIAAGTAPSFVTVDPLGKFAYVANLNSNDVSAYTINQTTGALTAVGTAVAAGTNPYSVTVDPSGKFAYVANYTSSTVSQYTISPSTGALVAMTPATVAAGTNPYSVTVDPSGQFAYVANNTANTVSVYTIDPATGALTLSRTISTQKAPYSIAIAGGSATVTYVPVMY